MTICIVLDGFHRGETAILANAPPVLRLYRPRTVTTCECNPDSFYESGPTEPAIDVLKIAFRSIDGEVALYSTDGKSAHILSRGWVQRQDAVPFYREQELLYVGCRDHRAWPTVPLIEEGSK